MIFGEKNKQVHSFYFPIHITEVVPAQGNGNVSIYKTHDNSMYKIDELIVSQISQDEAPLISLPFTAKLTLTTVIMMSLLIGSYFKVIMYSYVFTTNRKNRGWMHRPINVITVTSAIIHHITHVSVGIWYVVILLSEKPLGNSIGVHYCQVMGVVGVYGLVYLSVGSLGISVYRILYITQEYWVKYVIGERLLLALVLSFGIICCGLLVFLFMLESSSHRTYMNMCTGFSVTQTQILMEYALSRGNQLLTTTYLQSTTIVICIAIQTIEFSIYIWVFYIRYKNDNGNIRNLLTQAVIRERNIKNVVTFLGQFYVFIMEYAFLISILVLTYFADEHTHHFKALVGMLKFIDFGLLSAVEVVSSPALRSFMR